MNKRKELRQAERRHQEKQSAHSKAKLTREQERLQRIYYQISRGRLVAKC